MNINYQGHKNRRKRVLKVWLKVVEMFNDGTPADQIAKKFKRTRAWVYWVLGKFKTKEL